MDMHLILIFDTSVGADGKHMRISGFLAYGEVILMKLPKA